MDLVNACAERESLGKGAYRSVLHLRPIAHAYQGAYRRNVTDWATATDAAFAKSIAASTIPCDLTATGDRRMYPTGDPRVYVEIGAPQAKSGTDFAKANYSVATLASAANKVSWASEYTDLRVIHAGHYVKVECELLKGFVPDGNLLAFPLTLSGLTLEKGVLLADGKPVGRLRDMIAYDADNPDDVRPVSYEVATVKDGTVLMATLPDLKSMTRPVVDPTFEAQPDAAAGLDTRLYQFAPTYNYGVTTTFLANLTGAYISKGLLSFDISSIPAGASVTSAIVALYREGAFADEASGIGAHRGLTQWYEGVNDGAAPSALQDGSTWNHRNANGSVVWGTGGGTHGGLSGTDFAASATATVSVTTEASYNWTLTADVTDWLGGTANYGWWFTLDTGTAWKRFASSDHATAAYRPKLTVEYTTGGAFIPAVMRHFWIPNQLGGR